MPHKQPLGKRCAEIHCTTGPVLISLFCPQEQLSIDRAFASVFNAWGLAVLRDRGRDVQQALDLFGKVESVRPACVY